MEHKTSRALIYAITCIFSDSGANHFYTDDVNRLTIHNNQSDNNNNCISIISLSSYVCPVVLESLYCNMVVYIFQVGTNGSPAVTHSNLFGSFSFTERALI